MGVSACQVRRVLVGSPPEYGSQFSAARQRIDVARHPPNFRAKGHLDQRSLIFDLTRSGLGHHCHLRRVVNTSGQAQDVVLLVDIANVMGSRPDGWWRDRAAAATRLLSVLEPLNGADVALPARLGSVRITEVRAVVEGAAKSAESSEAVSVLRADSDGDSEIVEEANRLAASGKVPLVVTADRGLHRRLPELALIAGPGWLNRLVGR
ncbi:MAG: hypothetical protein K0S98_1565, partial [Propionibacteriaceae bacterium]|nr:hypothetical protein [Propionibacteriaceae bacterium]